jgi:hypothetical protein
MKNILRHVLSLLIVALMIVALPAHAQWKEVGNPIFTGRPDYSTVIAVDNAGTPYVATVWDTGSYDELIVQKFNGKDWEQLGKTGIVGYSFGSYTLAIDPFGIPYVAVDTYSVQGYVLTVLKFENNKWNKVGTDEILSDFRAVQNGLWLAFSPSGTPFIALSQTMSSVEVLKFDGNSWVNTGNITSGGGLLGGIGFNNKNTLQLAVTLSGQSLIMEYDNTSWSISDTLGLGTVKHEVIWMPQAINSHMEYALLWNNYQNAPQNIFRHIGNQWLPMSNGAFPFRTNTYGLATDTAGTPYAFFVDSAGRSAFMKHDGQAWVQTDTSGCPEGNNVLGTLAGDAKGHFYIAEKGANSNRSISIKMFTATNKAAGVGSQVFSNGISLSPVPASNTIQIRNEKSMLNGKDVIVSDVEGRKIYQFRLLSNQQIDISNWASGMYFLNFPDGQVMKMIKN